MSDQRHKANPKAFDIFKPGKTPATPTSRPIITGQQPKPKDSTLVGKSDRQKLKDQAASGKPFVALLEVTPEPEAAPLRSISDAAAEAEKLLPEHTTPDTKPATPDGTYGESIFGHSDNGSPQVVVSHHARARRPVFKVLIVAITVIILAALSLDLLLDAGTIKTSLNVPHTHFLQH